MNTFREIWRFIADLWDTGNFWARLGILLLTIWPIIITIAALTPYPAIKAIVAMLPLLTIIFIFFAVIDPLVWAAVVAFPTGRRVLRWFFLIIGVELALGTYYAAVPVYTDRGLIPLVLLFALTGIFLAVGAPAGKIKRTVLSLIIVSGIVLTIIFFLGGREEANKKISANAVITPPPRAAKATQIYPNYIFSEGENEIRIPLLPAHQLLPREAGGWVIIPTGSRFRFDHDVPVVVENVDGHRKSVKPDEVVWLDVKPGNGLLRFYGEEGFVNVSIKRDFY